MGIGHAQDLTDGTHPVGMGPRTVTRSWSRPIVFAGITLAVSLGSLILLHLFSEPLTLLFMAIIIAEALAPVVNRLQRWMPRIAAVVGIYLILFALVFAFLLFVIPPLATETQKAGSNLPQLLSAVATLINRVLPGKGQQIIAVIQPAVTQVASGLAGSPLTVLSALGASVQVIFLSIYWLIAAPQLRAFLLTLVPASRHEHVNSVVDEINRTMGGYVRGTVVDAIIVGAILYIGLLLLGVKYALLLAVIGAIGEMVPIIGPTIAEILATAMALLISPERALLVLAFYLVLEQLDGNVILPLVIRQQANISPLLITFAVFAGAWVDGAVGALVAIPFAGAVQVLVLRVLVPQIQRWTGAVD